MIKAPNATNDPATSEADTTSSSTSPVKRGRSRSPKANVDPTSESPKEQPVKKTVRKTTSKAAPKTAQPAESAQPAKNGAATSQEAPVAKPATRRTRKPRVTTSALETPAPVAAPDAVSAPAVATSPAPEFTPATVVPAASVQVDAPVSAESAAQANPANPAKLAKPEDATQETESAEGASNIDTGVIIANAPYRQRTQRSGQSGQRQKNQRKPAGRATESGEANSFVQVPGPGGIFAPASMVALMNDPMSLPAVSASVSLAVNEIRSTMLAKRVPAQVPARVPEQAQTQPSFQAPVATAENAEMLTGVAENLLVEPLVESSAGHEEETPPPAKRRRSRRGGRGRKRANASQNAAGLVADSVEPGSDLYAESDAPEELDYLHEDTLRLQAEHDADSDAVEESGTSELADTSEQASEEAPRKPSRSRSRRRGGAARKAALEAARANTSEDGEDAASDAADELAEEEDTEKQVRKVPSGNRKMLISVQPDAQVEVVLTEKGKVQEYYVEMVHQAKIRGNIYKGVVSNVDTNLQAAFVNYGKTKNGFLQIDEIHPEYWLTHHEAVKGQKYPPIQKVIKAGQEVLIQVVKEPTGNKGAFLTTWVSLAGRFLVLTPGQEQIGISRKVEDGEERNRLRELIKGIEPGPGLGAIVRTVSAGTSKTTLQKDLNFLKRVWKDIRKRATVEKAPCLIYEEPGLATRAVRDYLSDDVSEVWVDDSSTATAIDEMAGLLFPRKGDLVHLYEDNGQTLWEKFGIQKQLEEVHSREVILPSGGRLVFDQTEALMAIDINSGKTAGKSNFASMAHRTNMEAAEVIARQLRLRDIGGQIVIDFIEMRDPKHCHEVEKVLRAAMKTDRARHDVAKMSAFGLLEIVRQRTGSSAISITQEPCPHCNGTGVRRNMEWQALQILRELRRQMRLASLAGQTDYQYSTLPEVGVYLLNNKRERLSDLEKEFGIHLDIRITGLSL